MKKPFGKPKKGPFGPSSKPGGGFRKFDRPDREGDSPRYGRPGGDRYEGGKPAWKKDRPDFDRDRPSYRGGDDRPYRGGGDKPGYDKPRPGGGFKPGFKPSGGKPSYGSGYGKPAFKAGSGPGRPGGGWRRDEGGPAERGERPVWKDNRPSYGQGGHRRDYQSDQRGDRPGGFKKFGDRPDAPRRFDKPGGYQRDDRFGRDDRPSGDRRYERDDRPGRDDRRPFADRRPYDDRKPYESHRPYEDRKPFDRKPYGDRKPFEDQKPYGDRPSFEERAQREERPEHREEQAGGFGDRVSVPSNKVNRPKDSFSKPFSKPFERRTNEEGPYAKALVVTLSDTNNVPTRIVWVFDSMVGELPEGEPAPGATVHVYDEKHRFIGSAIYNSHSRIRARIFSLTRRRFDEEYIREALNTAVARRKQLGLFSDSCRVIFGESDGIPGLVADKIGNYLVIQPLTFAVNQHLPFIIDRLNELVAPEGIVVRKDIALRAKEGLEVTEPEIHGEVPEQIAVKEEGVTLLANIRSGQKTGLFLDQRLNRAAIQPWCTPESRVLDLFCHVGGWGLRAARYGAQEVIGVDSSSPALELAEASAKASGLAERTTFVQHDVFEYLREADAEKLFDIIIVDPPAFAKTRQHYEEAFRAYLSLNYLAMKKLKPGGLLVTCSCSQAMSVVEFNEAILTAARNARMQFQVLERRGAPADHPVLLGLPETEYLKCFVLQRTE